MKRFTFSILLGLLLCIAPSVQAQVTIGLGTAPNAGSLLDLKEQDVINGVANSTKGLGMPRVKLTDKSKLQPMYSYADATAANTPDATALAAHTGLMVYNIDQCTLQGKGLYVWDGTQWQILGEEAVTLEGMVKKLGTAQDAIASNGAAWHKDQSGNIFLSGDFGTTAGRWMITNLAATTFVATGRTGSDTTVPQALATSPSSASDYKNPLYTYPNLTGSTGATSPTTTSPTLYTNNPRLGLLYNWAAATNSKGGVIDGLTNIVDGEDASSPDAPQTAKIQGICPNGWHLPSDAEYTALEQEISTNTGLYSSIANSGTIITKGATSWRGTTHGQGMKEVCPTPGPTVPILSKGASNGITSISPSKPGFMALLAGYAGSGSSGYLGSSGYFWSSSSYLSNSVWSRAMTSGNSTVSRLNGNRGYLFSVRCKKD